MNFVAEETKMVDLRQGGRPEWTAGYFIAAPRPAVIEPGGQAGVEAWLEALEQWGVPRDEVAYLVVTHIHMDHAGGTGTLARHLPKARVVVHPRGARHLQDPVRLVESARIIFGDRLESLFGMPEPVPADRIHTPEPGDSLDLGGGHRLRFLEATGHARHHYMILDEGTGALMTGDELGVAFPSLSRIAGRDYLLPSTAPNQFDPDRMIQSAQEVVRLRPGPVLLAHFGPTRLSPEDIARRLAEQIPQFVACGIVDGQPVSTDQVLRRLSDHVRRDAEAHGLEWSQVEPVVAQDLEICAHGIADYHRRMRG